MSYAGLGYPQNVRNPYEGGTIVPYEPRFLNPASTGRIRQAGQILALLGAAAPAAPSIWERYLSPYGLWNKISQYTQYFEGGEQAINQITALTNAVANGDAPEAAQQAPNTPLRDAARAIATFIANNQFIAMLTRSAIPRGVAMGVRAYVYSNALNEAVRQGKQAFNYAYSKAQGYKQKRKYNLLRGNKNKQKQNAVPKRLTNLFGIYLKGLILYLTSKHKTNKLLKYKRY